MPIMVSFLANHYVLWLTSYTKSVRKSE